MGRWSREELEEAFENYQRVALECGPAQSWDPFVDLFTQDCVYLDHPRGVIGGREALRRHYRGLFTTFPHTHLYYYPVEWYMVDEERGWISCLFYLRMDDPGDGSIHQVPCFGLLKYAGRGLWKCEEDMYDVSALVAMFERWTEVKRRCDAQAAARG